MLGTFLLGYVNNILQHPIRVHFCVRLEHVHFH